MTTATEPVPSQRAPMTSERGREMGKRSGRARQRLTLDRVEAELPHFDSVEHIKRGCELVQRWAAAGLLAGSVAGACVRAAEIGLRALEAAVTFEAVEALRADVEALRAERDQLAQEVERLTVLQRRTA